MTLPQRFALQGLALAWTLLGATAMAAEEAAELDDGPYVFLHDQALQARWICAGKVVVEHLPAAAGTHTVPARCGYPHPLPLAPLAADEERAAAPSGRIVALSDIHGQYPLLRRLLRAHGVIDAQDRWQLGRDQLVVAGDVFDRGPQVTEVLWLLQQLQQQARARRRGAFPARQPRGHGPV